MRSHVPGVVLFLVAIAMSLGGCFQPDHVPQSETDQRLRALAVLYGRYVSQHRGNAPASENVFKEFIKKQPAAELETLKVSDPNAIFVSPRDNQPYVVKYNQKLGMPGPQGAPVIAHEQAGEGGKRYVATALGEVKLVDDAAFQTMAAQ